MRPLHALLVVVSLAGGAAGAGWMLWSETEPDRASRKRGLSMAAALRAGVEATAGMRAPHRCARLHPEELGPEVAANTLAVPGMRAARRRGPVLSLELEPTRDAWLTIGLVADAHGAVEALPGIQQAFRSAGVRIVISLGGLGRDRDTIARALAALAEAGAVDPPGHTRHPDAAPEPRELAEAGAVDPPGHGSAAWLVVAVPGDWEAIPEHRAAVAALADRGVVDGSEVRLLDLRIDGADRARGAGARAIQLATLPGAAHPSRHVAGTEGCVFTTDDAAAILALLGEQPGVRLLLSHAPPRQGPAGLRSLHARPSDAGRTAIPAGERALADLLRETPVHAVIHGLVAARERAIAGEHALDASGPALLAAGSLDPLQGVAEDMQEEGSNGTPRGPTALVVTITGEHIAWRTIMAPGAPGDPAPRP